MNSEDSPLRRLSPFFLTELFTGGTPVSQVLWSCPLGRQTQNPMVTTRTDLCERQTKGLKRVKGKLVANSVTGWVQKYLLSILCIKIEFLVIFDRGKHNRATIS